MLVWTKIILRRIIPHRMLTQGRTISAGIALSLSLHAALVGVISIAGTHTRPDPGQLSQIDLMQDFASDHAPDPAPERGPSTPPAPPEPTPQPPAQPPPLPPPLAVQPPPIIPELKTDLGIEDSTAETKTWKGALVATPHEAPKSEVDQPAMALDPRDRGPSNTGDASPATPPPANTPPAPASAPAPSAVPSSLLSPMPAGQPLPIQPLPAQPDPKQDQPLQPKSPQAEPLQPQPQQPEPFQERPVQPLPLQPAPQVGPSQPIELPATAPSPLPLSATQPNPAQPLPVQPLEPQEKPKQDKPQQERPLQPEDEQPLPVQEKPLQPADQQLVPLQDKPVVAPHPLEGPPFDPAPSSAPIPPPSPAAPPPSPRSASPDAQPGEQADEESSPAAIVPSLTFRPGQPLAGPGLQVRTVNPRWGALTRAVSTPRDTVVRVTFGRSGKVIRAEFEKEGTGYPDVDGPLLDAIYRWTAKGEALQKIPPGDPRAGATFSIKILMHS